MAKYSCHDTPFLCEYCQARGLSPIRVENSKLELLRVKERKVLRIKSEPRPCNHPNNNSKHNFDQKATQTNNRLKRSKITANITHFPNGKYEKEIKKQETEQEPSTLKAYSFRERTERKQRYLPEQATTSNRNERNSPKLWRPLKRTVSKITKESGTDDTSNTRKLQTRESSKKRKIANLPEQYPDETHLDKRSERVYVVNQYETNNSTTEETTSSSEYSQELTISVINGNNEDSELERWYKYRKPESKSKEIGTKPSRIPVRKRRQTKRTSTPTTSNSGKKIETIKPFKESASEYKLLRVSQISHSTSTSPSGIEEKHSEHGSVQEIEHSKDSEKASQTDIKEYISKTKTPPPIKPKPKPNKMKIEGNKEDHEKCTNYPPGLELPENIITKTSDFERKHSTKKSIRQSTLEQSLSTRSIIIISNQESDTHSPKPEHSIGSMNSTSYILQRKCELFESSIKISVPNSSQETAAKQLFEAQGPVKDTQITTKYSDCPCESSSQKSESLQKYGITRTSDSIQELVNDETLNECSYIPIIKSDLFEPIQQDCSIDMVQERSPEVAENVIDRVNGHSTSIESNLFEDLKGYERFRNYTSIPKLRHRSNVPVIENSDDHPLPLKRHDELEKQVLIENSQQQLSKVLQSDSNEPQDSLSKIFEQAKKKYKDRKLMEETELFEQKMQSFRLYEYIPDLDEKNYQCEEKGSGRSYRKRPSTSQSLKSIEGHQRCRSPELSTSIESTNNEQLQNLAHKRQEHHQESTDYEAIKSARDVARATELNEYRQGSDLDNRLLKPFKYPTSIYEKQSKYQPMTEPSTTRTKSLRSTETQTLPEHARWENLKTTTRNRATQKQKSINSVSEESERSLENISEKQRSLAEKQDPLSDPTGKNGTIVEAATENLLTNDNQPFDLVSPKSSQDHTESRKDLALRQEDAGISLGSRNRRESVTSESINLGNNVTKKERPSLYCRDPLNKLTKSKEKYKNHKENKMLENKKQTDCDCVLEKAVEESTLLNNEMRAKQMKESIEKDALLRKNKKGPSSRTTSEKQIGSRKCDSKETGKEVKK
ncbi:uncharacterized protein LOC120776480 [Bactrocera tryoni]|uniref:uncharacterized protein LOC120776480 n=1 Tax=Bactrocera tryoni TaxID=59916 RepID=UPI001A98C4B1|nr:uncharacterized protein LOC120776480 [Bactrocera tryoni]